MKFGLRDKAEKLMAKNIGLTPAKVSGWCCSVHVKIHNNYLIHQVILD